MTEDVGVAAVVALDSVLDIRAAAPLRDVLLEHRGMPVCVDASRVEQVGGLCLQVLIAARKAWATDQVCFGFGSTSGAFEAAVAAFGAAGVLGMSQFAE